MAPRVLIADDYADARELLVEFVGLLGYEVAAAENGLEAVERAIAFRPDVVLMDLAMPGLDGRGATAQIKADPRTCDAVVIAVTGHALHGQGAQDVCPGCDGLLVKPVLPEAIAATLRRALGGASCA